MMTLMLTIMLSLMHGVYSVVYVGHQAATAADRILCVISVDQQQQQQQQPCS